MVLMMMLVVCARSLPWMVLVFTQVEPAGYLTEAA
jgi:hypothetical protein